MSFFDKGSIERIFFFFFKRIWCLFMYVFFYICIGIDFVDFTWEGVFVYIFLHTLSWRVTLKMDQTWYEYVELNADFSRC